MKKNIKIFLLTLFAFGPALGADSLSRFSFVAGMGNSTVQSAEDSGVFRSEGPIGFGFILDYMGSQQLSVFAEHLRTSRVVETAVGLTGGGVKFYPFLGPKHILIPEEGRTAGKNLIHHLGLAPYVGASLGFFQASFPETDEYDSAIAAGFYTSFKVGADYPISHNWGLRIESNLVKTIFGAGVIDYMDVLGGVFLLL